MYYMCAMYVGTHLCTLSLPVSRVRKYAVFNFVHGDMTKHSGTGQILSEYQIFGKVGFCLLDCWTAELLNS
jgi:hypothetical protein